MCISEIHVGDMVVMNGSGVYGYMSGSVAMVAVIKEADDIIGLDFSYGWLTSGAKNARMHKLDGYIKKCTGWWVGPDAVDLFDIPGFTDPCPINPDELESIFA